ncbi:MAG: translation initiation factor eIF-1A [Thermoprotei archaeon]|nr:MAG: translation initiation factor eIF-1A [Thermoprotei archaeon]
MSEVRRIRLPAEGEMLGKVIQLVGDDRARVFCADGKVRVCRIPGRYRKRMWVREGDIVLVVPWDFQPNRADIVHKYEKNEVDELRKAGFSEVLDKLEREEII